MLCGLFATAQCLHKHMGCKEADLSADGMQGMTLALTCAVEPSPKGTLGVITVACGPWFKRTVTFRPLQAHRQRKLYAGFLGMAGV